MLKRIFAITLSLLMLISAIPLSASAADASATSLLSDVSKMAVSSIARTASSGSNVSFAEWFIGLFGYFRINNEAKLRTAAKKNFAHEYTLQRDITLTDTLKVTGTLNLKGKKTVRCDKTCFEISENGRFSSKDIAVISENGEAILNRAVCTVYSGTYKSNAYNAHVIRCLESSATAVSGGTFNNPHNTDLFIESSDANVFWSGGEANEACVKPQSALYITGGHIGTIINEGKFISDIGTYDKIVDPRDEAAKPQEDKPEPQVKKYEISSEKDLRDAAKEGGNWTVTRDFTVSSRIDIECASLKISGKCHSITMGSGKADDVIFNVVSSSELLLSSLNVKNNNGGCVAVSADSTLIAGDGEKCCLESGGDTIINSGFTQLSYSTALSTTGTDTAALKNNSSGKAELYNCSVNKIENDGTLILKQINTSVESIINNGTVNASGCSTAFAVNRENAVWSMSGGHVETFSNHGKLSRTGGTIDTLKDNYLIYPSKVMNITQNYNGSFSHYNHAHSKDNLVDYPVDEACEDTSRSYFYCPCDEMKIINIYGVGTTGTNTIWLQSTNKVYFADETSDYVTIMVIHPNDDTLKNLKVGQIFSRKDKIFLEGDDGNATGFHFHISVGKGKMTSGGWVRNINNCWVLTTSNGTRKPEEAFFIDRTFTTVNNSGGLTFKNLPD